MKKRSSLNTEEGITHNEASDLLAGDLSLLSPRWLLLPPPPESLKTRWIQPTSSAFWTTTTDAADQ